MREKQTFCYRGERERERESRGVGLKVADNYEIQTEAPFYLVKLLVISGLSLVLHKEEDCDFIGHSS